MSEAKQIAPIRPPAELVVYEGAPPPMSLAGVKAQVGLIHQIMKEVMHSGEHYGVIPGTGSKPSLLKPGAEKLVMTFRLVPDTEVEVIDLRGDHREYRVRVRLTTQNGIFLGTGVGSCSTLEAKYRYRSGDAKLTDRPVPKGYWDVRKENPGKAQEMIGGRGFVTKKSEDGRWMIATPGERAENDNPADTYNTVLKMAKKRALVDAVLTVTAASDIFTQDIEEEAAPAKPAASAPHPQMPDTETAGGSLPEHPVWEVPPPKPTPSEWLDKLFANINRGKTPTEKLAVLFHATKRMTLAQLRAMLNSDGWKAHIGAQFPPDAEALRVALDERMEELAGAQAQQAPPPPLEAGHHEGVGQLPQTSGGEADAGLIGQRSTLFGGGTWQATGGEAEYYCLLDVNGEVLEQYDDPQRYAIALESYWMSSSNREALLANNADAMEDAAKADPAAAKIIRSLEG